MIHSSTVEKWEKRRAKTGISNVNWSVAEPSGTCSDRLDDRPTFSGQLGGSQLVGSDKSMQPAQDKKKEKRAAQAAQGRATTRKAVA